MTAEQAIQLFDEHLVWLAKRRMINNTMLSKLSGALQAIVNKLSEQVTENQAEVSAAAEKIEKMRILLKASGMTEKGIEYFSSNDIFFLEKWAEVMKNEGENFPTPKTLALFEMTARHMRKLADTDVLTVLSYQRFAGTKLKNTVSSLPEIYPHLNKWFAAIDNGGEINEREVFNQAYKYRIDSWN